MMTDEQMDSDDSKLSCEKVQGTKLGSIIQLSSLNNVSPEETSAVRNSFETFVWPLLRTGQLLGLYPISLGKFKEAKISINSLLFRYSLILFLFRFGGIYWSRSQAFTPLVQQFISSPAEETFYSVNSYYNAIYQLAHTLNVFISLKIVLKIHKTYREFSTSFNRFFSKPFYFKVSRKRNLAIVFSVIPAVAFIFQFILRPPDDENVEGAWTIKILRILEVLFGVQLVMSLSVEDCKLSINCLCITDGYRSLNREIRDCLENPSFIVSDESISGWKHLSMLLQDLSHLTGSMTMLTQLTGIAHEIFLVTGLLYFNIAGLINGTKSIESPGTILPCVMIVWHSLRQYVKFNIANSMTDQSTVLVNYLRMFDRSKLDLRAKESHYDFTNHLIRNPPSINFGKYFTLNKASLFSVAGRVVTYLIVVIQFQAASK